MLKASVVSISIVFGWACSPVMAQTYTENYDPGDTIATYCKVRMPGTVLVNPRGHLIQGGSVSWTTAGGSSGETWTQVNNRPVFMQSRHVTQQPYWTLVPGGC